MKVTRSSSERLAQNAFPGVGRRVPPGILKVTTLERRLRLIVSEPRCLRHPPRRYYTTLRQLRKHLVHSSASYRPGRRASDIEHRRASIEFTKYRCSAYQPAANLRPGLLVPAREKYLEPVGRARGRPILARRALIPRLEFST